MKHIKTIMIAVLAVLLSHTAYSQSYINIGIGYGAPALRELVAVDYNDNGTNTTYTGVYSSFGQGLTPGFTFGWKFNPNVGMEFGYGYLLGRKITSNINDVQGANTETGTEEMWARMHQIMIGGRVCKSEGSLQPYMRVGALIGIGGQVFSEMETTTTGPAFSSSYHRIEEFNQGVALGFTGGLGVHYHTSDMFAIFIEANMNAQNWSPKHSEITTLHVDGVDQLGNMSIRDKETEYVKEYTTQSPPNDGQPDQDLRFFLPFSSIGIAAGLHFYFGE
jgi:opacity protein-like surface antigen